MGVANLCALCLTNFAAIAATIIAYKSLKLIHAIAPLLMLTQLASCWQTHLFDLGPKGTSLILGSFLLIYCLCQFTLTTKWIVQAPFALLVSQAGLFLVNQINGDLSTTDIISVLLLNTLVPVFIFSVSFVLNKTKVSQYLSTISEATSQIEMSKILQMIPQALFFYDEDREEVLQ